MRFLKKLAIFVIIIIVLIAAAPRLMELGLRSYVLKKFGAEFSVESIEFGRDKMTLKNASLTSDYLDVWLPEASVGFESMRGFKSRMFWINLKDPDIKIKDLKAFKVKIGQTSKKKISGRRKRRLFLVDVDNMSFSLKDPGGLTLDMEASLRGIFSGIEAREIEDIEIPRCDISSDVFSIKALTVTRRNPQLHTLNIGSLDLRGKEIKDIESIISIEGERIIVISLRHYFLGEGAFLEGILDLNEYNNMCGSFELKSAAFGHLAELFAGKESLSMRGEFGGKADFCLKDFKVASMKADLLSEGDGFVDIEKETSLGFLKKYLDKKSHDTLMDSLKSYSYDTAHIEIEGNKGNISVKANFESEYGGKRNIEVNFHDVLGGER